MKLFLAKTAAQRTAGQSPSRTRAFFAATVGAGMVGALAYKLLRSGN